MSIDLKGTKHRLTKQRKIILEELCKLCCHPTAETLYKKVKIRLKNVSLATVYRNLDFLVDNDYAIKLKPKGDGKARYDGDMSKHLHLVCSCCSCVIDVFDAKEIKIKSKELDKSGFEPCLCYLEIPGICKKCLTQKK